MNNCKFIYITDTHFMGQTPVSRIDDYLQTGLRKLREVQAIAVEKNITTILHGGDFFDSERPGYEVLNSTMKVLNEEPQIQWYINVGNHDLFGANFKTHFRTALFSLGQLSNVHILEDNGMRLLNAGIPKVFLHSKWFTYDREGNPDSLTLMDGPNSILNQPQNCYNILMAHVMLVEKSFFGNYISLQNLPIVGLPDLVLGSHYHPGWKKYRYRTTEEDCIFAHPGALLRRAKKKERRIPQILLVDIYTNPQEKDQIKTTIVYQPLKSAEDWPFKEDAPVVDEESLHKVQFEKFLEQLTIEESNAVLADPQMLIRKVAKEKGYSDKIVERAIYNLISVTNKPGGK